MAILIVIMEILFSEVIKLNIGVKTDKGKIRDNNQDAYYLPADCDNPLFIIADGMGGHKAGEIASNLAIDLVSESFNKNLGAGLEGEDLVKASIHKSINIANKSIYEKSKKEKAYAGMGTTVTLAYIDEDHIYIGHVGDSRAYILEDGNLGQVTEDHSLVEELIKNGSISKEEAKQHPQRNIITRAVGTEPDIDIDIFLLARDQVDILLLCTDGLTSMVDDNDIGKILIDVPNIEKACQDLVELSNKRGGYDNITVLAIDFRNEVIK